MKTPLEGTVGYFGHSYSSGKLYLLISFFGCVHILPFASFYKWESLKITCLEPCSQWEGEMEAMFLLVLSITEQGMRAS